MSRIYFGNKTFKTNKSKSTKSKTNDVESMKSIRLKLSKDKSRRAA